MDSSKISAAQQIAEAAVAFERKRTGHIPESVTVVMGDDTLVVTLHGALSPAERALAQTPAGASQVQEFHRQLFKNSADTMRQDIKRITGVEVRDAATEVEIKTGTVVQVFSSGTVVQVFLMAKNVLAGNWSDAGRNETRPDPTAAQATAAAVDRAEDDGLHITPIDESKN
jgi:uncharacterized protein YbcI